MAEQDRVVRNGEDILLPRVNPQYRPGWNLLANGDFSVRQRGETFTSSGSGNSDGAYTYDRWYLLSDGNDIVDLTIINAAPTPPYPFPGRKKNRLQFDVETANKKYGVAQILEAADCLKVIDGTVCFSFEALLGVGSIAHVKAAILQWTGTSDAPTRDFISSWNSDDTLPTLATNWAYLNSPVDLLVSSTSAIYSVTATVPDTFGQNLAVFLWSDSTSSTVGNTFQVSDVQLEKGSTRTDFQYVPYVDQLARCQRFYEVARYNEDNIGALSSFYNGTTYIHHWYYKVAKRIKPTVTLATGSWSGGAPTINEGIDSTCLTRTGAFYASGTSGNVCLAADAEL